jgi:hypothetical protein
VLLALPPADHLLNERDRGQFVPSRRRRMMANFRAECLLKIPAEPSPELRIPNAAAQTRIVSKARIRLDSRKSVRSFTGIICDDISEFESHMPSHAVGLSQVRNWRARCVPKLPPRPAVRGRDRCHRRSDETERGGRGARILRRPASPRRARILRPVCPASGLSARFRSTTGKPSTVGSKSLRPSA